MEWILFTSFAIVFLVILAIGSIGMGILKRVRRRPLFSGKMENNS